MADLLEEQAMEVEALESILMDDMVVIDGSEAIDGATHAPCYQITISALGDGEEEDPDDAKQQARLGLVFSHTMTYPEEPPLIRCLSVEGLFDSELKEVEQVLKEHASNSLGMSMIFDLVNEAREWMRTRAGVVDIIEETPEMIQRRLEEEAEERLRAMRAVGTAVTVDAFNEWVTRFEQETGIAASDAAQAKANASRITGRKYFEERSGAEEEVVEDAEDEDFVVDDSEGSDSSDSDFDEEQGGE